MQYKIEGNTLEVTAESEDEVVQLIKVKVIRFKKITYDVLQPVEVIVAKQ